MAINNHQRIAGLDSIRFLCAMFVLLGHIGGPFPNDLFGEGFYALNKIINVVVGCFFNGPAAVIGFFIISGFCIHYPFSNGEKLVVPSYYARRLIRILIPAMAAVFIWRLVGLEVSWLELGVFWSIVCEVIYYLLYPGLSVVARRRGFGVLVVVSYATAILWALINLRRVLDGSGGYAALGLSTWVIGLPCWLLGCWLAENRGRFPSVSMRVLWRWRIAILVAGTGIRVMKFHAPGVLGSNVFLLSLFAPFAVVWLGLEISSYANRSPVMILERAGSWSYSLYLLHPVGIYLAANFFQPGKLPPIFLSLVLAYIFYRMVELPAHKLAGCAGRWLKTRCGFMPI